MNDIILALYETLTSCAPAALAAALLSRKYNRRPKATMACTAALFIVYIAAVLHITGAGTLFDAIRRGFPQFDQCNLVPLVNGAQPLPCLLNIVLFIPLGYAIGRAGMRYARMRQAPVVFAKTTAWGFALSLAIETSQLLNNRVFDVDDLVMNALGTFAGCALVIALRQTEGDRHTGDDANTPISFNAQCAIAIVAGAGLIGRFLLFDELGVASVLYGF